MTSYCPDPTVEIRRTFRTIRTLPGRPVARLVEGTNGHCYHARFAYDSHSRKTLLNEWVGTFFLQHFHVSTTVAQILSVTPQWLAKDPGLSHLHTEQSGSGDLLCLGSQLPVHLEQQALWPFLPSKLWHKILNLEDFATTFLLDQWSGTNRCRSHLFCRDRPTHPHLYRAYFADHQALFGGSTWKIENTASLSNGCDCRIYGTLNPAQWLQALDFVGSYSLPDCQAVLAGLPDTWLELDEQRNLERLFDQLQHRQQTLSEWIQIPSRCLHFPAQQTLRSVCTSSASATVPPTLSPV